MICLTLLWYLLYCGDLQWNPKYLQGKSAADTTQSEFLVLLSLCLSFSSRILKFWRVAPFQGLLLFICVFLFLSPLCSPDLSSGDVFPRPTLPDPQHRSIWGLFTHGNIRTAASQGYFCVHLHPSSLSLRIRNTKPQLFPFHRLSSVGGGQSPASASDIKHEPGARPPIHVEQF